MKNKKIAAAMLAFSIILGGNSALAAQPEKPVQIASSDIEYSKEAIEALDYINKIRKDAGLGEVRLNPFLTKAGENHAKYLNAGNPYDHDEIEGKKGFTGVTPKDRVLAVGGDSQLAQGLFEVLSANDSTVKASIDGFINTAYHRVPFLDPYTMEVGVGFEGKKFVMLSQTRGSTSTDISMYPYNGQKNVPTTFSGADEDPNPLRKFGIERSGYVISFYPPHVLDTKTIDATIKDRKGTNVPFFSEWYMGYWFFYTKQPLKNGETYTVSVNYKPLYEEEYEGKTLNRTWSFTTIADVSSDGSKSETASPKTETQPDKKQVTVLIDGVKQTFDQPAIVKNGSTLVPLRGVFEALKADVKWDQSSQTVTANKGDTTIKLTVGQSTAIVNSKTVTLAAKAEVINGSTMVPLRFVSEALGADVKWDNATSTAIITSPAGNVDGGNDGGQVDRGGSQVVNGSKVSYGKHTYASANQSQYDQVMKIVNIAVSDMKSSGKLPDYAEQYLNGDRASNYSTGSDMYMGLKIIENAIGPLATAGATKTEISNAILASETGGNLLKGIKDVGVGDPTSAYDALVGRITDCDATSQTLSAVFDSFGFSSAVLGGSNHADVYVKVQSTWFKYSSGAFREVNLSKIPSTMTIFSQPTFGPEFTK